MNEGRVWRNAALLFATQLAMCAVVIWFSGVIEPYGDAPEYLGIARNISHGLGFTYDGVTAAVYRPPLFSSLLGFWFFVTHTSSVLSASIFQSLALAAGVVASYFLYRELFDDDRLSRSLAFIVALNPILFVNVVYVLQEPVLLLVTTVAAWLSVRLLRRNEGAVAAGLGWGVATLAKVVTFFAPVLLAIAFLWRSRSWRESRGRAIIIVALALAVIAPWTARNFLRFHRIIPVNGEGTGALEFFVGRGALVKAGGDGYVQALQSKNLPAEDYRRALWKFAFDHPALSAEQEVKNFVWFTQPYREWWGKVAGLSMRWYVWVWPALFFHGPLYLGLFVSGFLAWKERQTDRLFLFVFYLLYWAEYTVYWGEPRFAMPVFPVLLALGADGLRRGANLLSLRVKNRA